MAKFKNLHLVEPYLSPDQLEKIEEAAKSHLQFSSITFKAIHVEEGKITIEVRQGRSGANNYQTKARLVEIVHEAFDRFFPGWKMNIGAIPFSPSPVDQVDAEWIGKQMQKHKVSLKEIVEDTGLEKTSLSGLINGHRPVSQAMKALFYYYFLSK